MPNKGKIENTLEKAYL